LWWLVTGGAGLVTFGVIWMFIAGSGSSPGEGLDEESPPVVETSVDFDPLTLGGPPRLEGDWEWFLLQGGECLTGLPTPDTSEVTVVACGAPHFARYLTPIILSRNREDRYPGAGALGDQAREHCAALTASALGIGSEVTDLLVRGMYAPGVTAWQRGHRVVGCVVYREGGAPLPSLD
jgi:hypothetical protein